MVDEMFVQPANRTFSAFMLPGIAGEVLSRVAVNIL